MKKKLIEYLKKWLKENQEEKNHTYGQCCKDVLQIIDVAESMIEGDPPKRKRKRRTKVELEAAKTNTAPPQGKVTDKPWKCKAGHYFDFPKNGKSGAKLCPTCLTKDIEHNPDYKE